jgi:hypothetical protein
LWEIDAYLRDNSNGYNRYLIIKNPATRRTINAVARMLKYLSIKD